MNPMPETEALEVNLQERAVETPADNSLPAAQIIEEQNSEADATQNSSPRFLP